MELHDDDLLAYAETANPTASICRLKLAIAAAVVTRGWTPCLMA